MLKRATVGLAVILVIALVAVAVTGTVLVRRSFPQTSGEVALDGLEERVEVVRDEHGVPTIVASTAQDLFRAQGFVHAQDRFWEMDVRRHTTAGRLSELFGPDQVDTDRFIRTLGWRRVAEQELDLLAPDTVAMLEAYADGVNQWLEGRTRAQLSFEHTLLPLTGARGYEPEPWTPVDSIAWLKAMAWDLRANLEDELQRARLSGVALGDGRDWRELWPDVPDEHPVILPEGGAIEDGAFAPAGGGPPPASEAATSDRRLDLDGDATTASHVPDADADGASQAPDPDADADTASQAPDVDADVDAALAAAGRALRAAPQLLGDGAGGGLGSNSWVISPERSTTGNALLANDPHLGPSQPSLWYQVGLRCEPVGPDCPYRAAGFSFSGMPGIVIGHTDRVAWGFTNLGADVADLVIERLDGDRSLTEDGWEELAVRTETIRVAGGDDVEVTIRESRHGPLLSDVSDGAAEVSGRAVRRQLLGDDDAGAAGEVHAVALRWVALDPLPTTDTFLRLLEAQDWDSFRHAAASLQVPSQNLVYADVDGHIGYQAPGRIPVRRTGDGTLPLPGWTGEFGWDRFLDFEELPWIVDPPDGAIVTANQPVLPPGSEPFLTADAAAGYRAARITELLDGRDELTVDDLLEQQMDDHDANAAQLVPHLLDVDDDGDDRVAAMQQVLADWDQHDRRDSAGAAAFAATWRALLERTFHDVLPEWAWPNGGPRWWLVVDRLLDDPDSAWWDSTQLSGQQTRDDILRLALSDAHDELVERFGDDDPATWRWGELHTLTLTHSTFGTSGIGPVERLFNRGPLETAGTGGAVNATHWLAPEGYEVLAVPSMRMALDLGDLDAGRWIHHTGQSGRPFHPHYTDQAEPWRDGDTIPIAFSVDAVDAAAEQRLSLTPAD